jgi:hypothetical protein
LPAGDCGADFDCLPASTAADAVSERSLWLTDCSGRLLPSDAPVPAGTSGIAASGARLGMGRSAEVGRRVSVVTGCCPVTAVSRLEPASPAGTAPAIAAVAIPALHRSAGSAPPGTTAVSPLPGTVTLAPMAGPYPLDSAPGAGSGANPGLMAPSVFPAPVGRAVRARGTAAATRLPRCGCTGGSAVGGCSVASSAFSSITGLVGISESPVAASSCIKSRNAVAVPAPRSAPVCFPAAGAATAGTTESKPGSASRQALLTRRILQMAGQTRAAHFQCLRAARRDKILP